MSELIDVIPDGNLMDFAQRLPSLLGPKYTRSSSVRTAWVCTTILQKCVERVGCHIPGYYEDMAVEGMDMLYFCHFVLSQEVRSDDAWSALQVAITRFWMLLVEHVPESVASWLEDWYGALMERREKNIPDIRPIVLRNSQLKSEESHLMDVLPCCTFILNKE